MNDLFFGGGVSFLRSECAAHVLKMLCLIYWYNYFMAIVNYFDLWNLKIKKIWQAIFSVRLKKKSRPMKTSSPNTHWKHQNFRERKKNNNFVKMDQKSSYCHLGVYIIVSEWLLFFSHIMVRTSYILMRWWCLFCK